MSTTPPPSGRPPADPTKPRPSLPSPHHSLIPRPSPNSKRPTLTPLKTSVHSSTNSSGSNSGETTGIGLGVGLGLGALSRTLRPSPPNLSGRSSPALRRSTSALGVRRSSAGLFGGVPVVKRSLSAAGPGTVKKKKKKKKKKKGAGDGSSSSSSGSSDEGLLESPFFGRNPGDLWPGAMVTFDQIFDIYDVGGAGNVSIFDFIPLMRRIEKEIPGGAPYSILKKESESAVEAVMESNPSLTLTREEIMELFAKIAGVDLIKQMEVVVKSTQPEGTRSTIVTPGPRPTTPIRADFSGIGRGGLSTTPKNSPRSPRFRTDAEASFFRALGESPQPSTVDFDDDTPAPLGTPVRSSTPSRRRPTSPFHSPLSTRNLFPSRTSTPTLRSTSPRSPYRGGGLTDRDLESPPPFMGSLTDTGPRSAFNALALAASTEEVSDDFRPCIDSLDTPLDIDTLRGKTAIEIMAFINDCRRSWALAERRREALAAANAHIENVERDFDQTAAALETRYASLEREFKALQTLNTALTERAKKAQDKEAKSAAILAILESEMEQTSSALENATRAAAAEKKKRQECEAHVEREKTRANRFEEGEIDALKALEKTKDEAVGYLAEITALQDALEDREQRIQDLMDKLAFETERTVALEDELETSRTDMQDLSTVPQGSPRRGLAPKDSPPRRRARVSLGQQLAGLSLDGRSEDGDSVSVGPLSLSVSTETEESVQGIESVLRQGSRSPRAASRQVGTMTDPIGVEELRCMVEDYQQLAIDVARDYPFRDLFEDIGAAFATDYPELFPEVCTQHESRGASPVEEEEQTHMSSGVQTEPPPSLAGGTLRGGWADDTPAVGVGGTFSPAPSPAPTSTPAAPPAPAVAGGGGSGGSSDSSGSGDDSDGDGDDHFDDDFPLDSEGDTPLGGEPTDGRGREESTGRPESGSADFRTPSPNDESRVAAAAQPIQRGVAQESGEISKSVASLEERESERMIRPGGDTRRSSARATEQDRPQPQTRPRSQTEGESSRTGAQTEAPSRTDRQTTLPAETTVQRINRHMQDARPRAIHPRVLALEPDRTLWPHAHDYGMGIPEGRAPVVPGVLRSAMQQPPTDRGIREPQEDYMQYYLGNYMTAGQRIPPGEAGEIYEMYRQYYFGAYINMPPPLEEGATGPAPIGGLGGGRLGEPNDGDGPFSEDEDGRPRRRRGDVPAWDHRRNMNYQPVGDGAYIGNFRIPAPDGEYVERISTTLETRVRLQELAERPRLSPREAREVSLFVEQQYNPPERVILKTIWLLAGRVERASRRAIREAEWPNRGDLEDMVPLNNPLGIFAWPWRMLWHIVRAMDWADYQALASRDNITTVIKAGGIIGLPNFPPVAPALKPGDEELTRPVETADETTYSSVGTSTSDRVVTPVVTEESFLTNPPRRGSTRNGTTKPGGNRRPVGRPIHRSTPIKGTSKGTAQGTATTTSDPVPPTTPVAQTGPGGARLKGPAPRHQPRNRGTAPGISSKLPGDPMDPIRAGDGPPLTRRIPLGATAEILRAGPRPGSAWSILSFVFMFAMFMILLVNVYMYTRMKVQQRGWEDSMGIYEGPGPFWQDSCYTQCLHTYTMPSRWWRPWYTFLDSFEQWLNGGVEPVIPS